MNFIFHAIENEKNLKNLGKIWIFVENDNKINFEEVQIFRIM